MGIRGLPKELHDSEGIPGGSYELIEDSIDRLGYKNLFLNPEGLSPVDKKNLQTFRAVGHVLDDILSKEFDKELTIIHVDGSPSEQKRGEHRQRNATLKRALDKLQTKVSGSTRSTKQLFKTCKNNYRLPRGSLEQDILPVLREKGWWIHLCPYQADTCLSRVCQDAPDPDSVMIVTSDSDLIVYEGIRHIMMPVGKTRELQLFDKTKLLDRLDLPSEQHLLLVCIVTSNDYVKNLPYFGLHKNCDIIRDFDLTSLGPLGGSGDNDHRAEALMPFIQNYLDEVERQLGKLKKRSIQQTSTRHKQQEIIHIGPEYYRHAITAFFERMETPIQEPLEQDDESPHSHDIITMILQELYSRKSQQQQPQQPRNDTHTFTQHLPPERVPIKLASTKDMGMDTDTNIESAPSSTSTQYDSKTISECTRKRKRSLKHKQQRKDRFKAKKSEAKHKQWRESQFKSRTDIQKRYSVRTVNIHDAPNVDEAELSHMTVPKPRSQKQSSPYINNPVSDNNAKDTSKTTNGSSSQQKSSENSQQKKKKRKPRKRKPRKPKSEVAQLKSGFSSTFAISTQTIGSVLGCLRRSLLPARETGRLAKLSDEDIKDIAVRIDSAVATMAEARMFVFRAVEIMILDQLLGGEGISGALDAVAGEEDAGEPFDVLELLLEKAAGTAIIKHMFSLILNGEIERGRPKTVKEKSKAAKNISKAAYDRLHQILPGFRPVNKDSICVGRLIVDAAAEFSVQLRKHFRDLPFTIGARMLKCGWSEIDLPAGSFKEQPGSQTVGAIQQTTAEERNDDNDEKDEDDDEEDVEDEDEDEGDNDTSMRFAGGYIRHWWKEAERLPPAMQPLFCLRHNFTDPFITFEERALPPILWSTSKKNPNPCAVAASKIMTAKEASALVELTHGELIRILFYGEPDEIRKSHSVWQTSYGRRSTTMEALANNHPAIFDPNILHSYLDNKFRFINYASDCREKGIACDKSPPPLPTSLLSQDPTLCPQRFALNNIFSTNGKELHVTCFDTTKPYRSKFAFNPIYRIENRFPTLQSILDEFGVSSIEEIDVWGIDPGEVNTAAFCRILRTYLTSIDTNVATDDDAEPQHRRNYQASTNSILPPGLEAKNLVVSRKSLYQPVFAHRNKMQDLSTTRITVSPGQTIEGKLWAEQKDGQADGGTSILSISEILNVLPSRQYQQVADMEQSTFRFFLVQDILHGFYGSARVKAMGWDLKKAKKAEMDLAIDAILRECTTKTLFCYGNGSFRTGINLASPMSPSRRSLRKRLLLLGTSWCWSMNTSLQAFVPPASSRTRRGLDADLDKADAFESQEPK
ncbi:hypothetical protein KI688_000070 [Linnemannia hyalina]|uniref:PIN domain-like protein n=1 Tax=Linnemannia hyalina TaxID=64524 RepID=A0A9P7Y6D6_9FUNG|nr:hypothetical protein KI688_000070 [Linnemannia hyalina]